MKKGLLREVVFFFYFVIKIANDQLRKKKQAELSQVLISKVKFLKRDLNNFNFVSTNNAKNIHKIISLYSFLFRCVFKKKKIPIMYTMNITTKMILFI